MVRPTQKVALLVIDMQVHFGAIMRSEPSLVPNLNDLAAFMRSRGVPIVYTQHGHLDPAAEEDTNVEVAFWAAAGAESLKRGSEAWHLVDGLGQKPDDTYITNKNTYDAFQNTDLESLLQRWGVDTVIVGGVVTFACCETTARSAFTKNFNVIMLSDGNASWERTMHESSLKALKTAFGKVLTCDEVKSMFLQHRQ